MSISDTDKSILPDDVSSNDKDTNLQGKPSETKSVSAIQGLMVDKLDASGEEGTVSKGVPIHSFDQLIANMESLKIKFLN